MVGVVVPPSCIQPEDFAAVSVASVVDRVAYIMNV